MTTPFKNYAPHYDLLYRDKDYSGEAQFVRRLLERFLVLPIEQMSLLDLACGTGRHACELSQIGFEVEGSDISPDMVSVARENANHRNLQIRFHNESFQSCDRIGRNYDSVIAMFSAINYLTTYKELTRSLKNIRSLLKEGGAFCFDFWNGNAVLKNYSPVRVRRVQSGEDVVIRTSHTTLDQISQIATIVFDFILIRSGHVLAEFSETHHIRYFFPQEMMDVLSANGFEVVYRCPFMFENNEISAEDWNLTYIAKRCE